jgi:hypothetical protein
MSRRRGGNRIGAGQLSVCQAKAPAIAATATTKAQDQSMAGPRQLSQYDTASHRRWCREQTARSQVWQTWYAGEPQSKQCTAPPLPFGPGAAKRMC